MIGVGIHENLVLSAKTAQGEQGGIDIIFARKQTGSLFSAMVKNESVGADEVKLKIFTINHTDHNDEAKSAVEIAEEISNLREQFSDILSTSMPKASVDMALDMAKIFGSVGITAANESQLQAKLVDDTFLEAIFKSLCASFITAAGSMMDNEMLRVKLRRRGKVSHYPTMPYKGKVPEVWIESMQVPATSSKIAFSQWEIDNKVNDGTPIAADAPASTSIADKTFGGAPAPGMLPAGAPAIPVQPGVNPILAGTPAVQPGVVQPGAQPVAPVVQPGVAPVVAQPTVQAAVPPVQPGIAPIVQPGQPVQQGAAAIPIA